MTAAYAQIAVEGWISIEQLNRMRRADAGAGTAACADLTAEFLLREECQYAPHPLQDPAEQEQHRENIGIPLFESIPLVQISKRFPARISCRPIVLEQASAII